MRAILRVTSGPRAGERKELVVGKPLRVGRGGRADWVFVHDETMALSHFEVVWDGQTCRLRDVGKVGTDVNGTRFDDGPIPLIGLIRAGNTQFFLRLYPDDIRAGLPTGPPGRTQTPDLLAKRKLALGSLMAEKNLYAVLDAARDRRILAIVDACAEQTQSLLRGARAETYRDVVPYLMRIEPGSTMLEVLVNEGWGESWGVYLRSTRPFADVRKRLEQSLFVLDEETGEKLYFRFYDPRVLRLFWPSCSPRQKSEMLGNEIETFLLENDADDLLRLAAGSR